MRGNLRQSNPCFDGGGLIDRFTRRFHHIETKLQQANKSFDQSSLEEMDRFWEDAKEIEAREKTPA